jgi:hypothetical protein
MTKGTIKVERIGNGFTIKNAGGKDTFYFLRGLQKRGLFLTIQEGPLHLAHYLPAERIERFKSYAQRNGFQIA